MPRLACGESYQTEMLRLGGSQAGAVNKEGEKRRCSKGMTER